MIDQREHNEVVFDETSGEVVSVTTVSLSVTEEKDSSAPKTTPAESKRLYLP